MLDKNTIKKELYKQKPTADFNFERNGYKNYSTQLIFDNTEEIVEFSIPVRECEFEEVVPAQLLIRWLK